MNEHSPFDLQVMSSDLSLFSKNLTQFASTARGGLTWLKGKDGTLWMLSVASRDLEYKFEVFTVRIEKAVSNFRLATSAPVEFRPWPFVEWRVDVLRRAEYICKPEGPITCVGNNPLLQCAAQPGEVPPVALSSCIVAAGLLFTGSDQNRLLICVDWMPFNMIVTQEQTTIDDIIQTCQVISVDDYVQEPGSSTEG